jgi:anti-anti-sigma factor
MIIKKRHVDDITILELDGMLTLGSETVLAEAFKELRDLGRNHIIINLMKVKYIDSIGIGQLTAGVNKARESEGRLVLVRVNERITSLLEMTGLKDIIPIYETVEDALDAI